MEEQSPYPVEEVEENERREGPTEVKCRCGCILVVLLVLLLGMVAVLCTAFVLVLRPKKPVFSLHAVQIESLKLNVSKSRGVQLPPSSLSLSFLARNPNRVGIRYGSTELVVECGGGAVGVIRVPMFYQPPRSKSLIVAMQLNTFKHLNLTRLMNGESHGGRSYSGGCGAEIRIVGSIRAHLTLMNFSLPTIKMALDCRLTMDYGGEALIKGIRYLKNNKALLVSSLPHFLQKCTFSPYF